MKEKCVTLGHLLELYEYSEQITIETIIKKYYTEELRWNTPICFKYEDEED